VADFTVAAQVRLWGDLVGVVAETTIGGVVFEYAPEFRRRGLEISPRHLPLGRLGPVEFPSLRAVESFQGLPGVLADSLPDRFGNAVIKQYFERKGAPEKALSPVQRLLYVGRRAMGALEFEPALDVGDGNDQVEEALTVAKLVTEARQIIEGRTDIAVPEMMQLGASAGGARPKAVILWNPLRGEVRSGTAAQRPGDEHWLLKFDGVGELEHPDPEPQPYNRIEYAYFLMAKQAGIETAEVRLLEERRLGHLMSKRFDRGQAGGRADSARIHMHSLGGLDHADYNLPGRYSYEQYLRAILELALPPSALDEAFRRMAFNVVAVNQDDHVKNFAFLMDREGKWRLSPAYDLTFAKGTGYTRFHQMSLNGKTDRFTRADLLAVGAKFGIKRDGAHLLDQVVDAVGDWERCAVEAKVPRERVREIEQLHRGRTLRA
jgi:serine/threonine-protein kinase HipA